MTNWIKLFSQTKNMNNSNWINGTVRHTEITFDKSHGAIYLMSFGVTCMELLCLKNVCFVFFFIFSVVLYSFNTFCRDFLPRGSGIVTRRPLILQLINGPAGKLLSIFFRFDPMIFHVFSFFSIETQSLASSCIAREGNSWISMRFEGKLRLKPIE